MSDQWVLVFRLRAARRKARPTAILEAESLLSALGGRVLEGGPLSDEGGVFWLSLPSGNVERARPLLARLGYATSVTALTLAGSPPRDAVKWRGRSYSLQSLYVEDEAAARAAAPDRRPFVVKTGFGRREIVGYRGDGGALSRRGLPAYDARVLANLAGGCGGGWLADPFAGVGGVVREATDSGAKTVSVDNDPWLAPGLAAISCGRHVIADCRAMPFSDGSLDAVATEPPYDPAADDAVLAGIAEISRVLRRGGRASMLCARRQAALLAEGAAAAGLRLLHQGDIDRKGTACNLFLWEKS